MELIPIIYNILLLVVVLAIITIIVSYRAHNAKQIKEIAEPYAEKEKLPIEQTDIMVKKVYKRITNATPHKSPPESRDPNKKADRNPTSSTGNKKNLPKENGPAPRKNGRIEIINKAASSKSNSSHVVNKKTEPKTSEKKSTEEIKLNTLSDKIIDKYDDDSNDAMYTLNVKKDNKKKEI